MKTKNYTRCIKNGFGGTLCGRPLPQSGFAFDDLEHAREEEYKHERMSLCSDCGRYAAGPGWESFLKEKRNVFESHRRRIGAEAQPSGVREDLLRHQLRGDTSESERIRIAREKFRRIIQKKRSPEERAQLIENTLGMVFSAAGAASLDPNNYPMEKQVADMLDAVSKNPLTRAEAIGRMSANFFHKLVQQSVKKDGK